MANPEQQQGIKEIPVCVAPTAGGQLVGKRVGCGPMRFHDLVETLIPRVPQFEVKNRRLFE